MFSQVSFERVELLKLPSLFQDLKIVHPVAVRASPDNHPLPPEGFDRGRALSGIQLAARLVMERRLTA